MIDEFDKFLLETNLVGAKTLCELEKIEKNISSRKVKNLLNSEQKTFDYNFDYECLKQIHKYIFGEVYSWAGQDRLELGMTGSITKGNGTIFSFGYQLPDMAKGVFGKLAKDNFLKGLEPKDFLFEFATLFANLNLMHPFREGNGRTQRVFLNLLAKNAGYNIDLNLVDKEQMIEASAACCKISNADFTLIDKVLEANFKLLNTPNKATEIDEKNRTKDKDNDDISPELKAKVEKAFAKDKDEKSKKHSNVGLNQ